MDAWLAFEARLSEGLSEDPQIAKEQATANINRQGSSLQHEVEAAFGGTIRAMEYGVLKVPAIAFDGGKSVIYGITDLHLALDLYRNWRGGQ